MDLWIAARTQRLWPVSKESLDEKEANLNNSLYANPAAFPLNKRPIDLCRARQLSYVTQPREPAPCMLRRMNAEHQHQVLFRKRLHYNSADADRDSSLEHPLHIEVHRIKSRQDSPLQFHQISSLRPVERVLVTRILVGLRLPFT